MFRVFTPCLVVLLPFVAVLAETVPVRLLPPELHGTLRHEPLVELRRIDRSIPIELRYASANNIAGRPIYPRHFQALLRESTARRVAAAQKLLRRSSHTLVVWDAYRPLAAQRVLREASGGSSYFADAGDPSQCLHAWGVAVDCTLGDRWGKPLPMPTDFDNFTLAANYHYVGPNPKIKNNLRVLRAALGRAGFYGIATEWWHFVAQDWEKFGPIPDIQPPGYYQNGSQ